MSISERALIGKNVVIREGAIIEEDVVIGDNCYIDYNAIVKSGVRIGSDSFIGAGCIIGEFLGDFYDSFEIQYHPTRIGKNATIRSQSIIYGDCVIGDYFTTGHKVTIREKSQIGEHVSVGTLSDIQGDCIIGNYTRLHSNVHIGMKTVLKDFVWVFPYVVFTNDPTPPSTVLAGSTVESFAVISTGSVILPGLSIGENALIGAGATVTKDAPPHAIIVGTPGKNVGNVEKIRNAEGKQVYPWHDTFSRGMPWAEVGYEKWNEQRQMKE